MTAERALPDHVRRNRAAWGGRAREEVWIARCRGDVVPWRG